MVAFGFASMLDVHKAMTSDGNREFRPSHNHSVFRKLISESGARFLTDILRKVIAFISDIHVMTPLCKTVDIF